MRRFLIAGNWKMNLRLSEAEGLFKKFSEKASELNAIDTVIAAPHLFIPSLSTIKSDISLAAQNFHQENNGAYTGEISISMLRDFNVNYSLVGHSERRAYFNEKNEILSEKLRSSIENNFNSILCVGETLEERENNKTIDVIKEQLNSALSEIPEEKFRLLTIAYEPVWAIGTGKTASPEDAENVHLEIRSLLKNLFSERTAESCRILYGGSMNASNAKDLLLQKNIDGGLIGGASLKSEFMEIMRIANKLSL